MSQSIVQHYSHLIYSTKNRAPLITPDLESRLWSYLGGVIRDIGGSSLLVGGVRDHVHILYRQPKNLTIPQQVEEIKKASSKWVKTVGPDFSSFYWQRGYGSFSVSPSRIESVKKYIIGQEEHHRVVTFKDEFRRFLKEYEVKYDERYVWD